MIASEDVMYYQNAWAVYVVLVHGRKGSFSLLSCFHLDAIDDRGCEPIPLAFDTDKGDNAGAFFAIPLEGGIE